MERHDSYVPVKSGPFIDSSEVGGSKLFGETVTVPGHYFVPVRGYPTLFHPMSYESAVLEASPVQILKVSDGFAQASGFSITREFSCDKKISVGTPVYSESLLLRSYPSGEVLPLMKQDVPIVVFEIISLPTPFKPDDPCVRPLQAFVSALFATLYFLGSLRELFIYEVTSVFTGALSLFSE